MAWYYGVNNSELYGSNFSTVLADAPPPLDDTFDEEDNEIVFPNEANKSKKYNGDSRNEKFSDKSKFDSDVTNGKNKPGKQDHVEEDSDFGDFAGFADFGSAFEQENNGESQDWFACNESSVKTASGEPASDDEFADFAAFGDDKNNLNQEKIANGGLNQGDSVAYILNNHDKNEVGNEGLPTNGSYDIESDDEFGEFASTDLPTVKSEQTSSESDSKSHELQTDIERSSPFQGKTCMEDKVRSDGVSVVSEETEGVMSNSDIDDVKTVSHLQELSTSEFSNKLNKETNDVQKEILLSKQEGKVFHPVIKNDESVQLKSLSAETQENTEEEEKTDSSLSRKSDEVNNIKNNMNDSSRVEHGSGGEDEHEKNNSDEDGFGEFSDFSRFSMRPPSLGDDDDDDEKQCNEQLDSPGVSKPTGSQEVTDSSCIKVVSVQDENCVIDDEDDFGDFGSFNEKYDQSSIDDKDFPVEDSKQKYSPNNNGVAEVDDDFGNVHFSNSEGRTLSSNNEDNNDFGDFGVTDSSTKDSQKDANDDDDFGEFGSSDSAGKMFPAKDQVKDKFGGFDHFDSNAEELKKDEDSNNHFAEFGSPTLEGKTSPAEDQDDDFDDFGTFRLSAGDSKKADDNCVEEFGDFGNFESSNSKNSQKYEEYDDFGDFSNFESNTKVTQEDDSNDNSFGDFGAFDSNEKESQAKNESEFGNLGSFEFKMTDVPKENDKNLSNFVKSTDDTEDFRTSDWHPNVIKKTNANEPNKNDVFGALSSESKEDDSSFASFSASKTLTESPREDIVPKEKSGESLYFAPGDSVIIKQVGDPVSLCFTSEVRHISQIQCDVLSMKVKKGFQSELGLWHQLECTDKEGRIPFHWLNSFSQHKKFLSLKIRPDRPPPIHGGSMLKPTVSSQFPPFGGGLAGSVLMPAPLGKLPNSSSGLGFLEPVKGSHLPVHSITQDKTAGHHSVHPEMGLPDLSFVLGGGLKRTASKSEFKDTVSDTTSESSSLDLDIFAPSMTQASDAKSDSKGLYETDLLGLDIFSSSVEPQKVDSPKLQKPSDTNRVWQHGGVTIPLSSQQQRAPLSAAAKTVLNDLEDLSFMSSSVLMFPLKPE